MGIYYVMHMWHYVTLHIVFIGMCVYSTGVNVCIVCVYMFIMLQRHVLYAGSLYALPCVSYIPYMYTCVYHVAGMMVCDMYRVLCVCTVYLLIVHLTCALCYVCM